MKKLYLLLLLAFAVSFTKISAQEVKIDWNEYIESQSSAFRSGNGVFYAHCFVDNNANFKIKDEVWIPIFDTLDIRIIKGLPHFSGISVSTYSASGQYVAMCEVVPIKLVDGQYLRLDAFNLECQPGNFQRQKSASLVSNSVLSTGKWAKFSVTTRGIYKITYSKLKEAGISSPENVAVCGNGGAELPKMNNVDYPYDLALNPVFHGKDANGEDAVFFYAPGNYVVSYDSSSSLFTHSQNSYSDISYYYVSSDVEPSPTVPSLETITEAASITYTNYDYYTFHEDEIYNIMSSGRKLYGDIFSLSSSKSYTLSVPNIDSESSAYLTVAGAGRSDYSSYFNVYVNTAYCGALSFNSVSTSTTHGTYASHSQKTFTMNATESNNISLNYLINGSSEGKSWLDFIAINAKAKLLFDGNTFTFRNASSKYHNIVEYKIEGLPQSGKVWNITDPRSPVQVSAGATSFCDSGNTISEYVVFNPQSNKIASATLVGDVSNQNIKGLESPDMVIVTHPNFVAAAKSLAEHRASHDGLVVSVVTTTEVYNEFSSGMPDVSAIRNMARFFYQAYPENSHRLKYLLLMGDGHNNCRSDKNYIHTYQSVNSLNGDSFVTDDFFGLLDDNEGEVSGYLDIGVGRITCKTKNEADNVISKIISYDSAEALGEWRNTFCFLADDEDGNEFMSQSDGQISVIKAGNSNIYFDKIYFDAYQQKNTSAGASYPDVTDAINQRINNGTLLFSYVGHANNKSMSAENVLGVSDVNAWDNMGKLPVFVTATCEFSVIDGDDDSIGEIVLSNANGGGVALFSTTRVVYSSNNNRLCRNFYSSMFETTDYGNRVRLGDIVRLAKNKTLNDSNKFSFILLGDPSMSIAFPENNVKTISINGTSVDAETASIGALDKVTIKGEITDEDGNKIDSFNGEITSSIYDKETTNETLANDGGTPYNLTTQKSLVYKGISTVTNGEFEFSFVVPKDILYNIGNGKIFYYATDGETDANGSCSDFVIGGTGINPIEENNAPEIDIYINDESFKPYQKVASNILLLVNLFDETGINTVGAGIGHDLVGILDDDYTNEFVLNDYYTSSANSYQSGSIVYPITGLEPGEHKITVKVWDVQNNSAEKDIYFIVEDGFKILSTMNYPNPVENITNFVITHNLPGEIFNAKVEIFALNGQCVSDFTRTIGSSGGVTSKIQWNTFDSDYVLKGNEILVYRVTLTSLEGEEAIGVGKLFLKKRTQ